MKQHSNQKPRPRGSRPNNQRKGPSRNQNYDSNGPSVRIRGSAHQVMDKYLTLARDAAGQGDRVLSENYLQHAEHYFRIVQSQQPRTPRVANPAAAGAADGAEAPIMEDEVQVAEDETNAGDEQENHQPRRQPRPRRPRRTQQTSENQTEANEDAVAAPEAIVERTNVQEAPEQAGEQETVAV